MKKLPALLILLFMIQPAFAAEGRPTADAVRELMEIMESQKMLEKAMGRIDAMTQQTIHQVLEGQPVTPEQEEILEDYQDKMVALYQEEMSWGYMEPIFIEIYQNSFSQEEIDGLIAFYRSDLGKAVIHKMPIVLQHTMQAMQGRMMQIMPRMQKIQQEMVAQLKQAPGY